MKLYRLSSNWTLLYRLFIPTFWITFFGAVVITIWFLKGRYFGAASANYVKALVTSFYLTTLIILYFTVIQLKRVEIDKDFLYVTNYFRHLRYPLSSIEKITERNFGLMKVGKVYLNKKGTFGKEFIFMISRTEYPIFWDQHPEINQRLRKEE